MSDCLDCKNKNDLNIIESLQAIMSKKGYIEKEDMILIAKELKVSESEVYGVFTFYSQFLSSKPAKNTIEICTGTACFILGANMLIDALKTKLGINENETTPDGKFKIATIRCLGCCSLAPVMRINGKIYSKVTPTKAIEIIEELEKE